VNKKRILLCEERAPYALGRRSRPAALARPHAVAATATAALARARTARQTCRNCRRIATSTPLRERVVLFCTSVNQNSAHVKYRRKSKKTCQISVKAETQTGAAETFHVKMNSDPSEKVNGNSSLLRHSHEARTAFVAGVLLLRAGSTTGCSLHCAAAGAAAQTTLPEPTAQVRGGSRLACNTSWTPRPRRAAGPRHTDTAHTHSRLSSRLVSFCRFRRDRGGTA